MVTTRKLTAPGGRSLHVYDTQSPSSTRLTIFWHHGTPNIGCPPETLLDRAGQFGFRWISYDRPGYGSSSRLAERERSAGELVAAFSVSQPAVSRQLRVLREAGLVKVRGEGQRRIHRLEPAPLAELDAWLSRYRHFWNARLDALEARLEERRRERAEKGDEE